MPNPQTVNVAGIPKRILLEALLAVTKDITATELNMDDAWREYMIYKGPASQICGRVLECDIHPDAVNPVGFDRANRQEGMFAAVVNGLHKRLNDAK
ncbi:hypothetical protein BDV25DRAFT_135552 [Aspergillus avenaceus]|uniref:Uncharacterized protein n=1 Tax=Aspergillus avenaceus TaxID=36643 RepID=A0A5N6U912_ASPAV|nr:hypothetical protein BDV25DRAFT_135552 [Aspergillus avenaceus]